MTNARTLNNKESRMVTNHLTQYAPGLVYVDHTPGDMDGSGEPSWELCMDVFGDTYPVDAPTFRDVESARNVAKEVNSLLASGEDLDSMDLDELADRVIWES